MAENSADRIWLTNEWNIAGLDENAATWRTLNWIATPKHITNGDVNGDGIVNCTDVSIVKAAFGQRCHQAGYNLMADVNQDCVIDIRDLATVSQQLSPGAVCR